MSFQESSFPKQTNLDEPKSVTITKLEAAERQLQTAIRLFFEDRDMISVQTLIAATHEIFAQLTQPAGGSLFFDNPYLRPERKKEWINIAKGPANFFKHAGRDRSTTIKFYPDAVKYWIFDCITMHEKLKPPHLKESILFMAWFVYHHREYFESDHPFKAKLDEILTPGMDVTKDVIAELLRNRDIFP